MNKYKILWFSNDETDYFQEYLNELDKKELQPKNIDIFTKLVPTKGKHKYKVLNYKANATKLTRKKQMDALINDYTALGYDYCGKLRKMLVFRSSKSLKDPKEEKVYRPTILNKICAFLICLVLSTFVFELTNTNSSISNYVTDGSTFLHFTPLIICFIITYYFLTKLLIQLFKKKINYKVYKIINSTTKVLLVLLIVGSLCSFVIDDKQRTSQSVNNYQSSLITLKDFNKTSTSNRLTKTNSILIDNTYFLVQTNKSDTLYLEVYKTSNTSYLNTYLKKITKEYKTKKIENNAYQIFENNIQTGLITIQDNKLFYLTTSFDISNYQNKILDKIKRVQI
ncbi:MAG: hypothetical protein PHH04_04815 [Thomasclavelia sp.]|nr:hypothetical protein [Thomasclavelia sp.]